MVTQPATLEPCSPEDILSLLRDQMDMYMELSGYAGQQRSLIAEEDTGPLLAVLAKRQKLSARLGEVVKRLEPVRRDWAIHRTRFNLTQRREAEGLLAEIRKRLREIIERDEEDVRMLSVKKQAAVSAMGATHSTGQALSAYRDHGVRIDRLNQLDKAS